MLWIAFAIVFVVVLFSVKNKSVFKNEKNEVQKDGLIYSKDLIGNLVAKDTDLDGVPDWEEALWGTDPRKTDTNGDGIPDGEEIARLKMERRASAGLGLSFDEDELTETDKFSREFFATVASLSQNGSIDQETVEKLGSALAERLQNPVLRKVYTVSDLKMEAKDNEQTVERYSDDITDIFTENRIDTTVPSILERFAIDDDDADVEVLLELDPIIEQTTVIIDALLETPAPGSLQVVHLDMINGLERLLENISDIRLYDTDVIVSLGGISQYEKSAENFQLSLDNLARVIIKRLSN